MKTALLNMAKRLLTSLITDSEKRKKVIGAVVGLAFMIIIIPVVALSLPGILFKGIFNHDKEIEAEVNTNEFTFDQESLLNNEMYINVRDSYIAYINSTNEKIDKRVEEIKEEYTYEKEVEVEEEYKESEANNEEANEQNTKTTTKTVKVVPEVIKDISFEKPELRHLLAYIGTKYLDKQTEEDGYVYDKEEALNFFDNITTYEENVTGTDPVYFTVRISIMNLESIAELYFTEGVYGTDYTDKQQQYLFSYESMGDFKDELVSQVYDYIDISNLNIHGNGMEIPHILQYDPLWGASPYGNSTVAKSGCAIASMAMVEGYLNGQVPSPAKLAEWSSSNGYYVSGQGTAWSFFEAYSNKINIKCNNIGKDTAKIIASLEDGKPVIVRVGSGTFTKGGHMIVLRGITSDGKILVNDPNDNFHTKNFYSKEFDFNLIIAEGYNFWSFEKN